MTGCRWPGRWWNTSHATTRAKTLFATHYHELTELAEAAARRAQSAGGGEGGGRSDYLSAKVEPGKADRSYGIEVARLAGLPVAVIERAREVLKLHERTEHRAVEQLAPQAETGRSRFGFSSRGAMRSSRRSAR